MINQKERNLLFLRTQYEKCDSKDTERIEKLDDAIYACEYCNCGYAHTENAFIHADYCRTKDSKGYCPENYDYITGKTSIVKIEIDKDDKKDICVDYNHNDIIEQLLGNRYRNFSVGYDTIIIDELVNNEKEKQLSMADSLVESDDLKINKDGSVILWGDKTIIGVDYADMESKTIAHSVTYGEPHLYGIPFLDIPIKKAVDAYHKNEIEKAKEKKQRQKIKRLSFAYKYGMNSKTIVKHLFDTETLGVFKPTEKLSARRIHLPENAVSFKSIGDNFKELEVYDYKIPTCRIVVTHEELAEHIEGGFFKKDDVLSKRDLADSLAIFKLFRRGVVDNQVVRNNKGGFKDYLLDNCERDRDVFACRWEYLFDLTKINEEQ